MKHLAGILAISLALAVGTCAGESTFEIPLEYGADAKVHVAVLSDTPVAVCSEESDTAFVFGRNPSTWAPSDGSFAKSAAKSMASCRGLSVSEDGFFLNVQPADTGVVVSHDGQNFPFNPFVSEAKSEREPLVEEAGDNWGAGYLSSSDMHFVSAPGGAGRVELQSAGFFSNQSTIWREQVLAPVPDDPDAACGESFGLSTYGDVIFVACPGNNTVWMYIDVVAATSYLEDQFPEARMVGPIPVPAPPSAGSDFGAHIHGVKWDFYPARMAVSSPSAGEVYIYEISPSGFFSLNGTVELVETVSVPDVTIAGLTERPVFSTYKQLDQYGFDLIVVGDSGTILSLKAEEEEDNYSAITTTVTTTDLKADSVDAIGWNVFGRSASVFEGVLTIVDPYCKDGIVDSDLDEECEEGFLCSDSCGRTAEGPGPAAVAAAAIGAVAVIGLAVRDRSVVRPGLPLTEKELDEKPPVHEGLQESEATSGWKLSAKYIRAGRDDWLKVFAVVMAIEAPLVMLGWGWSVEGGSFFAEVNALWLGAAAFGVSGLLWGAHILMEGRDIQQSYAMMAALAVVTLAWHGWMGSAWLMASVLTLPLRPWTTTMLSLSYVAFLVACVSYVIVWFLYLRWFYHRIAMKKFWGGLMTGASLLPLLGLLAVGVVTLDTYLIAQ